jgi:hypothetical protein
VRPTKGCRRHGKALRVFIGMLYYFPCKIVVCDRGAMRLNPVRWAKKPNTNKSHKEGIMSLSKPSQQIPSFSSKAIRLMVGVIPFILPILVSLIAFTRLTSISASYYTRARDVFVGLLFVLGALLFVYKGHTKTENWIANLGGLAAIIAALFPMACDLCTRGYTFYIHAISGNVLFGVTAYFCLGPFRHSTKDKNWIKAKRRENIYSICGFGIIACMMILLVLGVLMTTDQKGIWTPVYWGEFVMLWLFSAAWNVAAKWIPWFTDKEKD